MPSSLSLVFLRSIVSLGLLLAAYFALHQYVQARVQPSFPVSFDVENQKLVARVNEQDAQHLPQRLEQLKQFLFDHPYSQRHINQWAKWLFVNGEQEKADALVSANDSVNRSNANATMDSAAYWSMRGDFARAMQNWNQALISEPSKGSLIFPMFQSMLQQSGDYQWIARFQLTQSNWWNRFLSFMFKHEKDLPRVERLVQFSIQSGYTLTLNDRKGMIARYQTEKRWSAAYLAWLNSLEQQQLAQLGLIYDGEFNLVPEQYGFSWRIPRQKNYKARIRRRIQESGSALHFQFLNARVSYVVAKQTLNLGSGRYRFSFDTRIDGLLIGKGLIWRIRCLNTGKEIMRSPRLRGRDSWKTQQMEFSVPAQCGAQELWLDIDGRDRQGTYAQGGVWFDKLKLIRL